MWGIEGIKHASLPSDVMQAVDKRAEGLFVRLLANEYASGKSESAYVGCNNPLQ